MRPSQRIRCGLLVGVGLFVALAGGCRCGAGGDGSGTPAGGSSGPDGAPKTWGTATLMETDNAGSADDPQVAFDASGNAVVVWSQSDGIHFNLWARLFVKGSGWGAPEKIETDDTGHAIHPQISVNPSGNAVVVWQRYDGIILDDIWANRFVVGSGWQTAQKIETDDTGDALLPDVAVDASGNAVAVWHQQLPEGGGNFDIWANRFDIGSGWGTPERIETDPGAIGLYNTNRVAIDTGGNAVAVWYQGDGTREDIWANRYQPGTGWGAAVRIETDDTGRAVVPEIAMNARGEAVVVWYQSDGTRFNIWANRYDPSGGWGTAEKIETEDAGSAILPDVGIDSEGNALAVWDQSDGTRYDIWSNRYDPATGWGRAEKIETDDGSADIPRVAVDSSGNAVAVWGQLQGSLYLVRANRFVKGTTGWGTSQKIQTREGESASGVQVAVDPEGNAIAVWKQNDGTRTNIWSNRLQ